MKKTLFTLACAALAAPAFAGEAITEPITIALPASTTTPTAYVQGQAASNVSQLVTYYATNYTTPESALYFVGGNNRTITSITDDGDGALTTSANVASVTLKGRQKVAGENFVMVMPGKELIGKVVNTLTLTGSGNSANTLTIGGDFVVAVYEGTTLVGSQTAHLDSVDSDDIVTCTLNLNNITFSESNRIMIAFRGEAGNATTSYTIDNIRLTATPEPATATLSLLALAGLASRRRRH